MKYTDEDVQRLVGWAESVLKDRDAYNALGLGAGTLIKWGSMSSMERALTPFRPNPEEELIEAMAKNLYTTQYPTDRAWDGLMRLSQEKFRILARGVLDVVKEKGLPT